MEPPLRSTVVELDDALARLDKLWDQVQVISGLEQAYDRGNVPYEEYQAAIEHNRRVDAAVELETEALRGIARRDPGGFSEWVTDKRIRLQMARSVLERECPRRRDPLCRLREQLELVSPALPLEIEGDDLSTQLYSIRKLDHLLKEIVVELERQALEFPPELRPGAPASRESPRGQKQAPVGEVPPKVTEDQQPAAESRRAQRARRGALRRAGLQRFAHLFPAGIGWIRSADETMRVHTACTAMMNRSYGWSEVDQDIKQFIPNIFAWTAHLVRSVDDFERLCQAAPTLVTLVPGTREATPIGYMSFHDSSQMEANAREAKDLDEFLAASGY